MASRAQSPEPSHSSSRAGPALSQWGWGGAANELQEVSCGGCKPINPAPVSQEGKPGHGRMFALDPHFSVSHALPGPSVGTERGRTSFLSGGSLFLAVLKEKGTLAFMAL